VGRTAQSCLRARTPGGTERERDQLVPLASATRALTWRVSSSRSPSSRSSADAADSRRRLSVGVWRSGAGHGLAQAGHQVVLGQAGRRRAQREPLTGKGVPDDVFRQMGEKEVLRLAGMAASACRLRRCSPKRRPRSSPAHRAHRSRPDTEVSVTDPRVVEPPAQLDERDLGRRVVELEGVTARALAELLARRRWHGEPGCGPVPVPPFSS